MISYRMLATVHFLNILKSIGADVLKLIKQPEIRNNEFYFLWKVDKEKMIEV